MGTFKGELVDLAKIVAELLARQNERAVHQKQIHVLPMCEIQRNPYLLHASVLHKALHKPAHKAAYKFAQRLRRASHRLTARHHLFTVPTNRSPLDIIWPRLLSRNLPKWRRRNRLAARTMEELQ